MDAVKPREDLVDVAVKFLENPKVKSSPLDYKKQFLRKKDLTEEEISLAIERSGAESHETEAANLAAVALTAVPPPVPARPAGWLSGWRLYMSVTATLVTVVIALYRLVQNYIVPFLAAREEEKRVLRSIEEDVRELREKMTATVAEVQQSVAEFRALPPASQGYYEKAQDQQKISELKAEMASLKGLLLGREQFAPPPALTPGIPAWQKKAPEPTNETSATESPDSSSANQTPAFVSSGDGLTNGRAEAVTRDGETTNRDEGETEGQREGEEVTPASADVEASDDVTLKHVVTTALMGDSPEDSPGGSPPAVDVSGELAQHAAVEETPAS